MACQHIATITQIERLSASRKSILYSLAACCDSHGNWPLDRQTLRRMAGLSERSLRDNLTHLREKGMVTIEGTTIRLTL